MTQYVWRLYVALILAPIMVAGMSVPVMAQDMDDISSEASDAVGQVTENSQRRDCETNSPYTLPERCAELKAHPQSPVRSVPYASTQKDRSTYTAPYAYAPSQATEQALPGSSTPDLEAPRGRRFTFPTSMYQARFPSSRIWGPLVGTNPNREVWSVGCGVLVERSQRKADGTQSESALPSWVCAMFQGNSRKLEPLKDSIFCQDDSMPNGIGIDGSLFQLRGDTKPRAQFSVTTKFSSDANTKTRICYVGEFGGRHLFILEPEGCTNYSYIWADRIEWIVESGDCVQREVNVLIYDYTSILGDLRRKLSELVSGQRTFASDRSCPDTRFESKVSCYLGKELYQALKSGQVRLSSRSFNVKVSLIVEGDGRTIVSEKMLKVPPVQNGRLRFFIPTSEAGKTLRIVVERDKFVAPIYFAETKVSEERCQGWQGRRDRCHLPLYLTMVAQ